MFLSSNKIIKSIIKIKAQNFDNKNKKQKIKQKHEAQKKSFSILSYLAFIKVIFLLLNTKLYSFIDKKKSCEEFPLIVIIKFIIFISI